MKGRIRLLIGVVGLAAAAAVGGATPAFAGPLNTYTCSGTLSSPGTIPAGQYSSLVMPAGSLCLIQGGSVVVKSPVALGDGAGLGVFSGSLTIKGGLTVRSNALFGAGVGGAPNSTPLTIDGPVRVKSDGALIVGEESPYQPIFAHLNGPVRATNASSVQIHNSRVSGPVKIKGGGGDNALLDAFQGFGPFNDLEDNKILGPVSETGYNGEWAGVLRNLVYGPFAFSNNSEAPNIDEYDIGSNWIDGPATCNDNNPAPNLGQSAGYLSIVIGTVGGDQASTCTGVPTGVSGPPVSPR
jgi:hypothetical protein